MYDDRSSKRMVLHWRGPLLAAGIFAVAFATLLLMAHQNQTNSSDMGSSLRQDPYGTSLLFDSYGRAGYQVERSQDEESLADQNASRTTAFFIGGPSADEWKMEGGKPSVSEKFRRRLEDFLARGGRVVLIAPALKINSESQHWEIEDQWRRTTHASEAMWVSPDTRAMPAGSEKMYIAADIPRLNTDSGWTVLYAKPAERNAKGASSAQVYMAMRRVGDGELIAASQESFLFNEAIKTHPNPALLDFLAGGRPVIWVDETSHGLEQHKGVFWLVQRYRLQAASLLLWATLLALLWSMSGDLVRRPTPDPHLQTMRQSGGAGVAARCLLRRSIPTEKVVAECWEQYRRRFPQDAEAISADPHWGAQLRAALAQPPLAGYAQISQLIAERRAFAKGPPRAATDAPDSFTSSP